MNSKYIVVGFYNLLALIIAGALQFLLFAFLPSVSPNIENLKLKNHIIDTLLRSGLIVLFETLVILGLVFFINYRMLNSFGKNKTKKYCFILFCIELLLLLCLLGMFMQDYYNRNIGN